MFNKLKHLLAPIRYWRELPLRVLPDRPATPNTFIALVFRLWIGADMAQTRLEVIPAGDEGVGGNVTQ